MRRFHRAGMSLPTLGTILLVLIAVIPQVRAAPAKMATRAASTAPAIQSQEVLPETSIDGPALWTRNPGTPKLGLAAVLAWTGTDPAHSLNVMLSSDGITFGNKIAFAETSATRPAVAAQSPLTTIVLAWTGVDPSHTLNLLCSGPACGISLGGEKKLTIRGQTSFTSPALVRYGSGYLLAWTGVDPHHSLNILPFSLTTSGSGFHLGTQTILSQFGSVSGPSLTLNPQNQQLLLSWSATRPTDELMFATSGNGTSWSQAQTLDEFSAAAPSGFAPGSPGMPAYWMAWTGTDPRHLLNIRFTQSFPQWPLNDNQTTSLNNAIGGPILGFLGNVGVMLLAWTGTDVLHHLNIATITTSAALTLDQQIDNYISTLSTAQLVGQTLMLAVYANSFNANLNQALTEWDVGSAIIYTNYNGGPVEPSTLTGLEQLVQALDSHAQTPLLLAIDEEGGTVDRLAPYYGGTPSARQLADTGNPFTAYGQAQVYAGRMRKIGLNVDFAPVVDVDQGGGVGSSRTFGTTVSTVTAFGGAFLDGLQQHGIAGTLKHWPGIGAATGNPDLTLPTINQSQAQMNAVDFPPFQALLSHQPGMIMVTTVMVPAYDTKNPAMLSPTLVTSVLRGQLGYQGVIVTDSLDGQGLIQYMRQQGFSDPAQGLAEAAVRAFLAGDDLIEAPIEQDRLAAVVSAMLQAAASGRISLTHLRASVHRIIRLKIELGLMSVPDSLQGEGSL
jgi:beta-N-acetylhexosaminidase